MRHGKIIGFTTLLTIITGITALSVHQDKPDYLSTLENEVLDEINLARTNPKTYARLLADYRATFRGNIVKRPGKVDLRTNEGTRAVDEAIAALNRQAPLPALRPSKGMSLAASEHAHDTGPKGKTGHTGSDGSKSSQRISRHGQWQRTAGENISYGGATGRAVLTQLIVDDGVPSRGHRKNIFNKNFGVIGIGCGPHKRYGMMCVQTFAGDYKEK
jgi:uncharacterized protein YkwD